MHVGIMRIALRLPESRSLKTRRQSARSLTQRIRGKFNVSVVHDAASDGEAWQSLTLLVAGVGNSPDRIDQTLTAVADFVSETRPDLEVLDYGTEMISGV